MSTLCILLLSYSLLYSSCFMRILWAVSISFILSSGLGFTTVLVRILDTITTNRTLIMPVTTRSQRRVLQNTVHLSMINTTSMKLSSVECSSTDNFSSSAVSSILPVESSDVDSLLTLIESSTIPSSSLLQFQTTKNFENFKF
jgi:hypothetical protein